MLKPLFLFLVFAMLVPSVQAQKKYINRKIAQKNYEGYMLMQKQEYDSALFLFNAALQADPKAFFIYQNRAICKLHLKDTLGAISDFKSNLALEPNNCDSKYALGNIYKHQKDTANTLLYFIPAINEADADYSQKKLLYMNNFVGHTYRLREKYDSALIYYQRVKNYTPENASVFINSAVCYFRLDSLDHFCKDLEEAFILGGDVNCIALKAYCDGCSHILEESGARDTLSTALDTRLWGIIPDTVYHPARSYQSFLFSSDSAYTNLKKIYYNQLWQICMEKDASYYRESLWAPGFNFYYDKYTDYYLDGTVYAKGTNNHAKQEGAYTSYYPDGTLKLKAKFNDGNPIGTWTYYNEKGEPDFQIEFMLDEFSIKIVNQTNPNYSMNTGNRKFKLLLDKWDKITFTFSGEFANQQKNGNWHYAQNKRKIVTEIYKKGKFKRGTMLNDIGQTFVLTTSTINAHTFIPPQITQVRNLYFDSQEAIKNYPFIRLSSF